jgi:hypothetical protein
MTQEPDEFDVRKLPWYRRLLVWLLTPLAKWTGAK